MSAHGGLAAVALMLTQSVAAGQQAPPTETTPSRESIRKLAEALANPLADVATLAFQFDWDSGVGPDHDLRTTLFIQPQVPVSLSKDWTLLTRILLPFVSQPVLVRGSDPTFGFGDVFFSSFLTPTQTSHLVWGIGPAFGLPMSTDPRLGSGTWQAGPTGAAVLVEGSLQVGAVASQLWPFADTGDVDRGRGSRTSLRPFIAYTAPRAVTFTLQSEATIDWNTHGDQAAIPVELLVSRLRLGFLPLSIELGGAVFVDTPSGGPDWKLRLAFVVVVPRRE